MTRAAPPPEPHSRCQISQLQPPTFPSFRQSEGRNAKSQAAESDLCQPVKPMPDLPTTWRLLGPKRRENLAAKGSCESGEEVRGGTTGSLLPCRRLNTLSPSAATTWPRRGWRTRARKRSRAQRPQSRPSQGSGRRMGLELAGFWRLQFYGLPLLEVV